MIKYICIFLRKELYAMKRFNAEFYKRLFDDMDNNAVMMRVENDGTYYPIWCSKEFEEMMEGTQEEFIRLESGGTMNTIHPDDRGEAAYLFKHRKAKDGSNSIVVRKITMKGNVIWVNIHYAFVEEEGETYAYCDYADITEIKKREINAEAARREREAIRILHGMMASGPWYMEFNEKGEMTSVTWTDTFRRMLGYESVEDFPDVLESWSDLLHEEDKERVLKEYNDTIKDYTGRKIYDVEYRLLTKDRGYRWFHAIGQLSRRQDGSPITYVGMFIDINEQKEMERKLKTSEQEKAVFDNMLDQFNTLADESLAVIHSNITTGLVEEIHGRDLYPTDYAGNTIAECARIRMESLLLEEDRKKYNEIFDLNRLLERSKNGEGPTSLVCFCRRHSGKQCFVKFTGSAHNNPVTGDVDVFGIETEYNSEMVDKVLDEKVLAEQYDMITYIVGGYYGVTIGDAEKIKEGSIFPKKRDGVYMDYLSEQVIPVITGSDKEREETAKALSLETVEEKLKMSEPYTVNVSCEIDGGIFNKRFTFYTVDRERHFYLLLKSDMTEVLREQNDRNEILANALREAEQANVAKTAFLSSMSHEIRTPMNAIIGLDSIALKDPGISDSTKEYLSKIGGSAKHLLNLINDMLDMSRIESGRMTIKHEEFSFREMLEQINTMINGQCQDKGLTYDCRINGLVDDYYIGDDMKLKQVIINILGNAVKFTPEGGTVAFIVEQISTFEDKATMRFIMKDNGIGMDKDYLPKIFDAFSQEDSSKTNKYGSTGLGMAITKNIVEMMEGDIGVESEKGVGSTFTVTVTLRKTDKKNDYTQSLRPQDMSILVIDDDPVACEHAKLVLDEIGIPADSSLSGAEALEMIKLRQARQEPYNLFLVDLRMPEQDGVEVTRKIRELVGDDSAIIILTAYSWDDVMDDALDAGVDSFMAKPLFATGVMDEFKSALKKKNIGKAAEMHRAQLTGRHILLAEDMAINAEIMKQLLNMRQMEVDHAENGQLVLEAFEKSDPGYYDAILMDVRMPVMDGLAATAAIRALEREDAKSIPIIAMTANAFDEDVQHSLQAGMNAHLSKPVEPEHLYETLETLIH